jgi:hypothetical protein
MLLPLLVSLLAADSVGTPDIQAPAVGRVKLALNQDGYFYPGDRVQLQVSSTDDGYLVVFRATTRGRIRVLFPLDPGDDSFLRGGKKYDVQDRSGQQTFRIDDEDGTGVIYAAISDEPFNFGAFTRGDHWDYRAFSDYQVTDDAEAEFADLIEKLTPHASYQFDLVTYHAGSASNYSSDGHSHYDDAWAAPCFGCAGYYGGSGFSVSLSFGYPYYYSSYSPWYFGYYPAYGPYYSNCYYGPCYGYGYGYPYHPYYGGGYYGGGYYGGGYGGGYNGRPPYQFKPGQPVTPVGYRPRTASAGPVSGPAIGIHPRGRVPFTSTNSPASPRVTPVTYRDDRTSIGLPRHRVGVEDKSPRRQLSDAPRTSRPVSTVDRSGRVSPSRSGGGDRAQGSPRRQPSDRSAQGRGEPSNKGEARGSAPSRREAPPSNGGSGGGSRPSGGGGGGGGGYRGGGGGGMRPSGGAPMRRP